MITKPGIGWKQLGQGVWEHVSGLRIHMLGGVRLPDHRSVWAESWPISQELYKFIRIAGGNRRRGLMMFGLSLLEQR